MKYQVMIRYGSMNHVARFRADFSGLRMGEKCVIRTERGVEIGTALSMVKPYEGEDKENGIRGEVLRKMTSEDAAKLSDIQDSQQPTQFEFCKKKMQERGLPMKLVSVEHLFGGTKTIFYFLSEGRVDFRELVKDLAQEYHTRIEMRQIGVRDEARLLADFEHCGRELCCKTFIKNLEPVTMKMAKSQKATLDPSKISGRCGRLMCCLRFEDSTYEELKRNLPRRGTRAETPDGPGEVTGRQVLAQLVKVELKDGHEEIFPLESIRVLRTPPKNRSSAPAKQKPSQQKPPTEPDESGNSK